MHKNTCSVQYTLIVRDANNKAGTDRDTGSVKPGSRPIFGSVSGWRTHFEVSLIQKTLFCYTTDTFCGSLDTELVS